MLSFLGRGVRLCDGLSRREVLRLGGLGFTGLALPDLFRARATAAGPRPAAGTSGKARSCILIFNYGGPSPLHTPDLKPHAPAPVPRQVTTSPTSPPSPTVTATRT